MVRAYVSRGARMWVVARAALSAAFLLAGDSPLRLSMSAVTGVIVLSVGLAFLDTHLRREPLLLGNLGISLRSIGALFAGPAVFGEITLRLIGAVLS